MTKRGLTSRSYNETPRDTSKFSYHGVKTGRGFGSSLLEAPSALTEAQENLLHEVGKVLARLGNSESELMDAYQALLEVKKEYGL